jgi:hypothetical protein
MFTVFENFTRAIIIEFSELDTERRAEERLLALIQKTSIIDFTASFRVKASKTNLGQEALVILF